VTSSSFLVTNVGTAPDNFATMLQGANYRDTGLSDGNAFVDWLKANSPVSPSWVQHGVGVIGTPAVTGSKNGPQTITMRLEGFDLTSLGSPANSTASIRINGTEVATATITPVINTTPIPSRKGVAEISFTLTKQQLLPWTKGNGHRDVDVMISVVADPTGTVAYVPMKVSKG
jgi:5'-nucleotidase